MASSDAGLGSPRSSGLRQQRSSSRTTAARVHHASPRAGLTPGAGLATDLTAVFLSLPIELAVLDGAGAIRAVNEAWRRFARENGAPSLAEQGAGLNYLEICRTAVGPASEGSREAADGVQAVLDGSQSLFSLEYPCHSPTERRFYRLDAVPLAGGQGGAVVSHTDITQRKRADEQTWSWGRGKAARAAAQAPGVRLTLGELQVEVSARDLIELAPDAMVVCDDAGRIVVVNRQTETLFGYTRRELLGQPIGDLLPERFHDIDVRHRRRLGAPPPRRPMALGAGVFGRRRDGSEFPVEISLSPLDTAAGPFIIWAIRDITQRRRLEATAHERASTLEATIEAIADAVSIYDPVGQIMRMNAAARVMLGLQEPVSRYTTADLAATMPLRDEQGQPLPPQAWPHARVLQTGEPLAGADAQEVMFRALDGHEWHLSATAAPVRDRDGHILAVVVVGRDVTERRRLERELAARASQIEGMFKAMRDGVTVTDLQGRILLSNPAFHRLFAIDRDPDYLSRLPEERAALVRMSDPASGRLLSADELPIMRAIHGVVLADSGAIDVHAWALDGRELDLNVSAAPFHDDREQIVGGLTVYRDVTRRRQLERERVNMVNMVSHELKHPLNIQQLAGGLIRSYFEHDEAPKQQALVETLDMLDTGVTQMGRLVSDLVEAAALETGQLALSLAPTDVAELARRVSDEQRLVAGRSLDVDTPKRQVMANVDAMRITQVLVNLLTNAFKYSPAGSPVRLRLRRAHGQARFEVRDAGPGIPYEAQQRIFERFYRVSGIKVQQGAGMGLGLGLYICRQLVELHGGRLDVDSQVGRGATFWFTLPLAPAAR